MTTAHAINAYNNVIACRIQPSNSSPDDNVPLVVASVATVGVTGLSIQRNIGFGVVAKNLSNSIGPIGGIASGVLSLKELYDASSQSRGIEKLKSQETQLKNLARVASAIAGLIAAVFYSIAEIAKIGWMALSHQAANAFAAASSCFWGIGYVASMAWMSYAIHECRSFDQKLEEYLAKDQTFEGLKFLLKFLTEGGEDAAGKNIQELKSRTSYRAVQKILSCAPALIQKIEEDHLSADANKVGKLLIEYVREEGVKKKMVYVAGLVASIFGLVAVVLGTVFSLGIFPMILFGLATAVNLIVLGINARSPAFQKANLISYDKLKDLASVAKLSRLEVPDGSSSSS